MSPVSRRNFIQAGTGAALTSMIPGRHFTLAAEQTATTQPAGDRVRFASIGVGIQGSSLFVPPSLCPSASVWRPAICTTGGTRLRRRLPARTFAPRGVTRRFWMTRIFKLSLWLCLTTGINR